MQTVRRSLLSLWVCGLLLGGSAAWAASEAEAEARRLSLEVDRLARKNAWSGVERAFRQLEGLGLPIPLSARILGAQAAMEDGDMLTALTRLQVGLSGAEPASDPNSDFQRAKDIVASLRARYGMVHIVVDESAAPILVRDPLPFAIQERQAIGFAAAKILEKRAFMGLLPVGDYVLEDRPFTVSPGHRIVEVPIGASPVGAGP